MGTVRMAQAPGGNSSICLTDIGVSPAVGTSANVFADKNNQNVINGITGRSTTKVRHAPGGASSLCLGEQDENVNTGNTPPVAASKPIEEIVKPAPQVERT